MGAVKPLDVSNPALQAVPSGSTLGDKLKAGAVIAASVGSGSFMAYVTMPEKNDWAKFSPSQKVSNGVFTLGMGLVGAGWILMGGGSLIGSNTMWRAGVVAVGGATLACGVGLSIPQKIEDKDIVFGSVFIGSGLVLGFLGGFFSPPHHIASALSHVAISGDGISATGQF